MCLSVCLIISVSLPFPNLNDHIRHVRANKREYKKEDNFMYIFIVQWLTADYGLYFCALLVYSEQLTQLQHDTLK